MLTDSYDAYVLANADEPAGLEPAPYAGGLPPWPASSPAADGDFDEIPPLAPVDAAIQAAWDALPGLHKARKGEGEE